MTPDSLFKSLANSFHLFYVCARSRWLYDEAMILLQVYREGSDGAFSVCSNALRIEPAPSRHGQEFLQSSAHAIRSAVVLQIVDLDQCKRCKEAQQYRHTVHEHDVYRQCLLDLGHSNAEVWCHHKLLLSVGLPL